MDNMQREFLRESTEAIAKGIEKELLEKILKDDKRTRQVPQAPGYSHKMQTTKVPE